MHTPYTDRYPEAVAIAAQSLAASLTAVLWSRPLSKRSANLLFGAALWGTVLTPEMVDRVQAIPFDSTQLPLLSLHVWLLLATAAVGLTGPRSLALVAVTGQLGLFLVGNWVYGSNDELIFAHLTWCGALLGAHALCTAPPGRGGPVSHGSFLRQDIAIFCLTVALAAVVMHFTFEEVIFNGDEVAYTYQADLYAHFKAYASVPPCPASFENFWVFRYHGRLFSQYTPGWPLFMAPFQRLGVPYLAGSVAAGILAVGVARLSRRIVCGFGPTLPDALRITRVAGPLGAGFMMLGPSVLLNGASRFSHTLVAACFAWAVENVAVLATPGSSRRRSFLSGLGLGVATSLCLATRPPDGGVLGVGIFAYFVVALVRRRVSLVGFLGTCLGFAVVGGLTLVILRLQLGEWFRTGYSITPLYHPDQELTFSAPARGELKYGVPLATGSYCWWPVAPALGVGGLIRALKGRERRVPFMLVLSSLCIVGFYASITFGRGQDDGLGPRYLLPVVVAQATGTAALLAPLLARLVLALRGRHLMPLVRPGLAGPGLLMLAAGLVGAYRLAPLVYPAAYVDNHAGTAPLRAARAMKLKNAVVFMEFGHILEHVTNLAQNAPTDPNPSVLNLIRYSEADDACVEKHFPGRRWYRGGFEDKLEPFPKR